MRLIWAAPTYGSAIPRAVRSQRAAIMTAANHGIKWAGDASPDRMAWQDARNGVIREALETDCDGVFWVDDDVILPAHAVIALTEHGDDFVTGVYFQRGTPHWPLVASFNGKLFQWAKRIPENVYAPVDGCGFGCVYTSRKILEALGAGAFSCRDGFSEDFSFCLRARDAGFQLHCDTRVMCGHLREAEPADYSVFLSRPESELTPDEASAWKEGTDALVAGSAA